MELFSRREVSGWDIPRYQFEATKYPRNVNRKPGAKGSGGPLGVTSRTVIRSIAGQVEIEFRLPTLADIDLQLSSSVVFIGNVLFDDRSLFTWIGGIEFIGNFPRGGYTDGLLPGIQPHCVFSIGEVNRLRQKLCINGTKNDLPLGDGNAIEGNRPLNRVGGWPLAAPTADQRNSSKQNEQTNRTTTHGNGPANR